MTQQIHSYSGQNYDRWVERNSNSSALGKVQKQYWFTKSAVIRKLGKKEDEHVVASDAELDTKIELFRAVESSTKGLQVLLADYQNKICVMAQEENALGRLLKEYGKQDRSQAGKMMTAVGKSLSYTAQQRVALRNPLVRLFQEVETFHTRAVEDTSCTVVEMEKIRTEYRGALMWMKNISQDFNPDQYHQLEKFREVQRTVKQKKAKFDRLKLKSLQKVDLLAASRCNMFSHALIVYQNNLITFSEKTSKALNTVANNFKGHHQYEFQVIKELAEPPRSLSADREEEENEEEKEKIEGDEDMFFNAEYHDNPEKRNKNRKGKKSNQNTLKDSIGSEKSDSLINLLECSDDSKGEELISVDQTQQTPGMEYSSKMGSQFSDFLTNNPEVPDSEKDTQQMLKELFDSPIRQPLPVFGTNDNATVTNAVPSNFSALQSLQAQGDVDSMDPFAMLQTQPVQHPQNMFLPSQLLDFGLTGLQPPAGSKMPPTATFPAQALSSAPKPSSNTQGQAAPTQSSASSSLKQEVQKLDWYKVFQDIDPLGDPASALFSQTTEDNKNC